MFLSEAREHREKEKEQKTRDMERPSAEKRWWGKVLSGKDRSKRLRTGQKP